MNSSKLSFLKALGLSALLAASSSALAAPVPLDKVVAVVNDEIVLDSEFKSKLAQVKQQLSTRQQRIPPDNILESQVMNRLVIDNIMLQLAKKQGIKVSDRQLNQAINDIAARNNMTLEQFRSALIAEGQDYIQAREQIRQEILLTQVRQSNVNRRISVSEHEISNFLKSDKRASANTELLLSVILVSIPNGATPEEIQSAEQKARLIHGELEAGANFAEVAIATSNAPNALNGGDMGWRKVSELPETLADIASDLKVGEVSQPVRATSGFFITQLRDKRGGEVQLVEQTKVRHILLKPSEIRSPAQTQRLVERLHSRLIEGESFDELAKELSDDSGSGSEGGDLGWASPGQMVPEFEQVMNQTSIGSLSEPFESRFGWHILEVQDRRSQDVGERMQEAQAKSAIRKQKFTEELGNWLREIRSQAYVEIKL